MQSTCTRIEGKGDCLSSIDVVFLPPVGVSLGLLQSPEIDKQDQAKPAYSPSCAGVMCFNFFIKLMPLMELVVKKAASYML